MVFSTKNLVEAALMFMRTDQEPRCTFDKRQHCTFHYDNVSDADIAFARSDAEVRVRAFNVALVQIKTFMYSAKDA